MFAQPRTRGTFHSSGQIAVLRHPTVSDELGQVVPYAVSQNQDDPHVLTVEFRPLPKKRGHGGRRRPRTSTTVEALLPPPESASARSGTSSVGYGTAEEDVE